MQADNVFLCAMNFGCDIGPLRMPSQGIAPPHEEEAGQLALIHLSNNYSTGFRVVDSLKETAKYDPLEVLPEEVWLALLRELITMESRGHSYLSTEKALYLLSVSAKWRRSIESMPLLWTDLILDDDREDLAMKIAISLHFSQTCVLSVQLIGPMLCWNDVKSLMIPHKERIREIFLIEDYSSRLTDAYYVDSAVSHYLLGIIPQITGAGLQHVDWVQKSLSPRELDGRAGIIDGIFSHKESRYIRSIHGLPLTRKSLRLPTIRNIQELTTHEPIEIILGVSPLLPHLKNVTFLDTIFYERAEQLAHRLQNNAFRSPSVSEPLTWTSLSHSQLGMGEDFFALLKRLPLLVHLQLRLFVTYLPPVVSAMQCLKSLRSCNVMLELTEADWPVKPLITEPLYTVGKLVFRGGWYISSQKDMTSLRAVANVFFSLMPNVQTLQLEGFPALTYSMARVDGFHKVHTLHLDFGSRELYRMQKLKVPNRFKISSKIKDLTCSRDGCSVPGGFLRTVVTTSIEFLRTVVLDLRQDSSIPLESRFNSLKILHVFQFYGAPTDWSSFTSLTALYIEGYTKTTPEARNITNRQEDLGDTTRFCVLIATAPDTCPALQMLSFGRFPDLDILLIMLERRNLSTPNGRSRIRRVELPTHRFLPAFSVIRDLLRGRGVERQSNLDASLLGNIEMLRDSDIPGCITCHKAQVFCDLPTSSAEDYAEIYPDLGAIPEYPETVDEILRTWELRSTPMLRWLLEVRDMSCMDGKDRAVITEESLESSS